MAVKIQSGIEIISCIYCEDVRQEANGKWTLLGVATGDLLVPALPGNIKLGVYIEAKLKKPYSGPFYIRIRLNDQQLLIVTGALDTKPGYASLPVGGIPVVIPEPGTIHFDASTDGEKWTDILSKKISVGDFKNGIIVPPTA